VGAPAARAEHQQISVRSPRDLELEAGSAAHYEDPHYYAKAYGSRVEDVRYYVDLASRRGGPVLEYGCGNGRIAIPIARAGIEVVGVDLSAEMLADLRARLHVEAPSVRRRLRARRGDMRRARLGRRFPLIICPFNAFLHLYTRRDVERFLSRVHAHLTPHGEFVFDVYVPAPAELARDPRRAFGTPRFRYPGRDGEPGTVVRYAERFDYDKLRQILFVSMEFEPRDGSEPWQTPLAHRQFYPMEIEALLHYNGIEIIERFGDFFRGPLRPSSSTMLLHCRVRRRF